MERGAAEMEEIGESCSEGTLRRNPHLAILSHLGLHQELGVDHEAVDVGGKQRRCWPTRVKGT